MVSSAERKAVETAEPLARALGLPVEVRPGLHENDRSATGYRPRAAFEAAADAFFARPDDSHRGWETARAAQARVLAAVRACAAGAPGRPTLFVGHGAAGTLLKCALGGRPVARAEDQPEGGGHHLGFALGPDALLHDWRPMEAQG